jgi:WD40 repeat protein
VAFSPDGSRVLSGSQDKTYSDDDASVLSVSAVKAVELWDAATGKLVRKFVGDWDAVFSVAFSPDGGRVLWGGWDKTLKLWDVATGWLIRSGVFT